MLSSTPPGPWQSYEQRERVAQMPVAERLHRELTAFRSPVTVQRPKRSSGGLGGEPRIGHKASSAVAKATGRAPLVEVSSAYPGAAT